MVSGKCCKYMYMAYHVSGNRMAIAHQNTGRILIMTSLANDYSVDDGVYS